MDSLKHNLTKKCSSYYSQKQLHSIKLIPIKLSKNSGNLAKEDNALRFNSNAQQQNAGTV